MPWTLDKDGLETWSDEPAAPAAPAEPGLLGKAWERMTTPIHEQLGLPKLDFGAIAEEIFNPRHVPHPAPKGPAEKWLRGAAEKFTGVASGLAAGTEAPINLALMGGGAALPRLGEAAAAAARAGDVAKLNNILKLINVVRGGEVAGGAAIAAHGAHGLATAETWPQRGFSLAELLMGGLGVRGGLKGPQLPEVGRAEVPELGRAEVAPPAVEGAKPAPTYYHGSDAAGARAIEETGTLGEHPAGESTWLTTDRAQAEAIATRKGGKVFQVRGEDIPPEVLEQQAGEPVVTIPGWAKGMKIPATIAESVKAEGVAETPVLPTEGEAAPVVKMSMRPGGRPGETEIPLGEQLSTFDVIYARVQKLEAELGKVEGRISEITAKAQQQGGVSPAEVFEAQILAQRGGALDDTLRQLHEILQKPQIAEARTARLGKAWEPTEGVDEVMEEARAGTREPTSPQEPAAGAGEPSGPAPPPPTQPGGGQPPSTPPPTPPAAPPSAPPPPPPPPPSPPAGAAAPAPAGPTPDYRLPGGGNPQLSQETKDALRGLFKRQNVGRFNANVLNLRLHARQAEIVRKYQDMVRGGVMNPVDAQHSMQQELKSMLAGIEDVPAGLSPAQYKEAMQFLNQKDWTLDRFQKFRAANALQSAVEHGTQLQKNELALMQRVFGRPVIAGQPTWFESFLEHMFKIHSSMRALVASADLSATMRQALVATVSHPGMASKAFLAQLRALASESQYRLIQESLFNNPMRQLQTESGLFLAERSSASNILSRFNTAGATTGAEEVYGGAYKWVEKLPWVGRSERAYITYLNKMRSDLFNKKAYDMLRDFQLHDTPAAVQADAFRDLARAINTMTGRGEASLLHFSRGSLIGRVTGEVTLGMEAGERALPFLNGIFFAPRFMASRLSMLRDLPMLYSNYSAPVRNEMLKDVAITIMTGLSGLVAVTQLTGAEVEWNPRSTDFAKVKIGDTRIDPWGGFQPWVRFLWQIFTGERKSVKTGEIQEFGPGFGQMSRLDASINFMLQKASPAASVGVDLLRGARFNGAQLSFLDDEFPWVGKDVMNRISPMVIQDIYDAFNRGSVEQLALTVPASLLGMSAQTYNPWEPVERPTRKVGP